MADAGEIRRFWVDEVGPDGWYAASDELDQEIRSRFLESWEEGARGALNDWAYDPDRALSLVILLDQFPRNMFRGSARAFSTDRRAICVARKGIDLGFDMRTPEPERQFFYLPLMHSESLMDQERCVRLMKTRMPETGEGNLLHAKVHREVIRKFGRFPYRNEALHRQETAQERDYLRSGGYGETLRAFQKAS